MEDRGTKVIQLHDRKKALALMQDEPKDFLPKSTIVDIPELGIIGIILGSSSRNCR